MPEPKGAIEAIFEEAKSIGDELGFMAKVKNELDKLFTFKRWQLELYLDLLNAVRGENPEFVVYNYDYTESRFIRGLPLIPSPGFNATFNF